MREFKCVVPIAADESAIYADPKVGVTGSGCFASASCSDRTVADSAFASSVWVSSLRIIVPAARKTVREHERYRRAGDVCRQQNGR